MMPVEPTALSQREVSSSSSTATWNPSLIGPMGQARAPSKSISAEARARVPSLSLSRLMRNPFGVDPSRRRGTRKQPRPRVPSGAPSGRAVTTNTSASATEQNHFSPLMRHAPGCSGSGTARAAFAPTSDPPWTSVRNCEARRHRS